MAHLIATERTSNYGYQFGYGYEITKDRMGLFSETMEVTPVAEVVAFLDSYLKGHYV